MAERAVPSAIFRVCLWVVVLPVVVWAYSQGAPSSACTRMRPSHGQRMTIRTDEKPPYSITVSGPGTYAAGQKLEVVIVAETGRSFRGFLLQARTSDWETNTYGTFTVQTPGTGTQCAQGALTHRSSHSKTSVTTSWTSPSPPVGDIVFVATIVEQYTAVWMNVTSGVIRDFDDVQRENANNTSPANATTGTVTFNDPTRCGEEQLELLPADQRPHVAMLCNDDAQCPCTWRCCALCAPAAAGDDGADGADEKGTPPPLCAGHAICRQPRNATTAADVLEGLE